MTGLSYYSVLGVSQKSDLETIKRAYRKKAIECHPDNGGNHEAMKLVNEAWFMLRDPVSRREYDDVLNGRADRESHERAAAATREARDRAESYPRNSADLDTWIDGLLDDFKSAQYSSSPSFFYGWHFPTAQGSVSATAFIVAGCAIGILSMFSFVPFKFHFPTIIFAGLGGFIGAWVGAGLHLATALLVGQVNQIFADASPVKPPRTRNRIVPCQFCSQSLRLPARIETLSVTCPKCRKSFTVPGKAEQT